MILRNRGAARRDQDAPFPWLLTAVDLITQCLMFMVLISSFGHEILLPPETKFTEIAEKVIPELDRQKKKLQEVIDETKMKESIKIIKDKGNLTLLLRDAIFFDLGEADLKDSAREVMARLGRTLAAIDKQIRVEGYTDDIPIRTWAFRSNWELSAARAIAVLEELVKHGVPPQRLAAAGYGEYNPHYPNNSDANRAANRRVEIVVAFHE